MLAPCHYNECAACAVTTVHKYACELCIVYLSSAAWCISSSNSGQNNMILPKTKREKYALKKGKNWKLI